MPRNANRIFRALFPLALLAIAAWGIWDEYSYRSTAVRTVATVRDWQPQRFGGFRGIATADIEAYEGAPPMTGQRVSTGLWLRPKPGDRLPVYYQFGSAPARIDSVCAMVSTAAGVTSRDRSASKPSAYRSSMVISAS